MNTQAPKEVLQAREKYNSIKVHCPTLRDLEPFPELLPGNSCPMNKKKPVCGECEHFVGFWRTTDEIASFMVFEGFCDSRNIVNININLNNKEQR